MINFSQIEFDKEKHAYKYNNTSLLSVTSYISHFKQPFDSDEVAKKVAAKTGKDPKQIQEEWEKQGEEAREKGTKVHQYIEDVLDSRYDIVTRTVNGLIPEQVAFQKAWNKLRNDLNIIPIKQEYTVGDLEYKAAGRIDLIAKIADYYIILDWKTGKKYETGNQYQSMKSPFQDLDDCSHNHYSLQTSLYRLMIDRNPQEDKIKISACYLLHLKSDGNYHMYKGKDYRNKWVELFS